MSVKFKLDDAFIILITGKSMRVSQQYNRAGGAHRERVPVRGSDRDNY